ncbi:hypothetical protein [Methylobacterium sp. Leaf361]|uniref:hypothetical protein n=1 Tax=Methylobacterium sp. Leaf361 TaxID=1736352 RepID=UPI0012FE819C|nr:hypothetical protein [Methylobacterium sp. Leaf361]
MPKSAGEPSRAKSANTPPYPERKRAASKALLKQLPSDTEINSLVAQYDDDNDASFAVRSCSYVHKMLERLIRSKCRALTPDDDGFLFDGGRNGIIAGFANQLRVAFAFQYIDFTAYDDLMLMNSIRNAFAHSLHPATFETKPIAEDCKKLFMYETSIYLRQNWEEKTGKKATISLSRAVYSNSIFLYYHALYFNLHGMDPVGSTPEDFARLMEGIPRSSYENPWTS